MHTLLPDRSERIHVPGAFESSTTRPPAATAAAIRAPASSRATETSTCIACRSDLSGSRSCSYTVEPWPRGSRQLSSWRLAYPRTARQNPRSIASGLAAIAS